jgi:hypothetical protein
MIMKRLSLIVLAALVFAVSGCAKKAPTLTPQQLQAQASKALSEANSIMDKVKVIEQDLFAQGIAKADFHAAFLVDAAKAQRAINEAAAAVASPEETKAKLIAIAKDFVADLAKKLSRSADKQIRQLGDLLDAASKLIDLVS